MSNLGRVCVVGHVCQFHLTLDVGIFPLWMESTRRGEQVNKQENAQNTNGRLRWRRSAA